MIGTAATPPAGAAHTVTRQTPPAGAPHTIARQTPPNAIPVQRPPVTPSQGNAIPQPIAHKIQSAPTTAPESDAKLVEFFEQASESRRSARRATTEEPRGEIRSGGTPQPLERVSGEFSAARPPESQRISGEFPAPRPPSTRQSRPSQATALLPSDQPAPEEPRSQSSHASQGSSSRPKREPRQPIEINDNTQIDRFGLIREIARGGMGQVFLARDTKLGRKVAIKFLLHDDPNFAQRFLIEARATARVTHENIVSIYEVGEFEGMPYMVLE
jgi:hypothetical protein